MVLYIGGIYQVVQYTVSNILLALNHIASDALGVVIWYGGILQPDLLIQSSLCNHCSLLYCMAGGERFSHPAQPWLKRHMLFTIFEWFTKLSMKEISRMEWNLDCF